MATHEALVQKLLAQSPPAELPDEVNSLKLLTSNASLVDSAAAAAARQVAHAHMVALDMPGGAGKVRTVLFSFGYSLALFLDSDQCPRCCSPPAARFRTAVATWSHAAGAS